MSGKVIRTLRNSKLATALTEAELRSLASCGQIRDYSPEETILKISIPDDLVFILQQGRVALHISIWPEKGRCGGETKAELTMPGETFGWTIWMRSDFLQITAVAVEQTSLVVLYLAQLHDTQTFMNLSQRMLLLLYTTLQENGLCPPNIQGVLELKHLLRRKG